MADGAKPDVPTTDRQNKTKKKHRPFYEAVDAHARRRLMKNENEMSSYEFGLPVIRLEMANGTR